MDVTSVEEEKALHREALVRRVAREAQKDTPLRVGSYFLGTHSISFFGHE